MRRFPMAMAENRLQPFHEQMVTEKRRQPEHAHRECSQSEDHQRPSHNSWRFVQMMLGMLVGTAFTEKRHKDLAPHVEGGKPGAAQSREPEARSDAAISFLENAILGEKSRGARKSSYGERGQQISNERARHMFPEPTHLCHILLPAHRVDDAAGAEE